VGKREHCPKGPSKGTRPKGQTVQRDRQIIRHLKATFYVSRICTIYEPYDRNSIIKSNSLSVPSESKSFYKIDRSQIAQWLTLIVDSPGLQVTHKTISLDALQRYRDHNIDYIDAYHAALAHAKGIPVVSFDRDFDRFTDIKRVESV